MSASAFCRRERAKLVALALFGLWLFGLACGPPKLMGDGDGDAGSGDEAESSTSESSSSSSSSSSETSTSETSTGETGTNDTWETMGFVPEEDEMWGDECDPFAQDCPEGEKCVPYASTGGNWDALKCVPVSGDQAVGEPCTYGGTVEATDDCDATSHCWDVQEIDGEWVGTCLAFCTGTADMPECPPKTTCSISGAGVINLCIPTCDPILQDCNEGLACYWASNSFNCIFMTEDIPSGEPCGFINDCAGGNLCANAESLPNCAGSACCSPWCQLGDGDLPCEVLPGTTCVSFFEQDMAPPGYEHVGVCLLPP
jgi:hypothetical protein